MVAFVLLALPAAASAADGGISGKVTLAAGGAPVQGARVCGREKNIQAGEAFSCVETAADGTYAITGLRPGDYRVEFSPGESGLNILSQYWNGVEDSSEASLVTVESETSKTGIDAAMVEGGVIAGRVMLAADGSAFSRGEVCAWGAAPGSPCGQTEADGTYEVDRLPPGDYTVVFRADPSRAVEGDQFLVDQLYNGTSEWQKRTEVTIAGPGDRKTGIDAALIEGGVIEGTLSDATSGAPIYPFNVCLQAEGFEESRCGYQGFRDSTYRFTGVHPGLVELTFEEYRFKPAFQPEMYFPEIIHSIPVSAGATLKVDAHLHRRNGEITGHVYAAATRQRLADVRVCAYSVEEDWWRCDVTDAAGAYEFYPLKPGAWKVVFSPDPAEVPAIFQVKADAWPTQFWNSKSALAEADTIDVTAGGVASGIDGLLGPGPWSSAPATNPPAPAPTSAPKPKRLHCGKGKVKKRVKGKARCVKRHKPRHRHRRHDHKTQGHRHR